MRIKESPRQNELNPTREALINEAKPKVDRLEISLNQFTSEAMELERQTDLTQAFLTYSEELAYAIPQFTEDDVVEIYKDPQVDPPISFRDILRGAKREPRQLSSGRVELYSPHNREYLFIDVKDFPKDRIPVPKIVDIEPDGEHLTVDRMDRIIGKLEHGAKGTKVQSAYDWTLERENLDKKISVLKTGMWGFNGILEKQLAIAAQALEQVANKGQANHIPRIIETVDSHMHRYYLNLKTGYITTNPPGQKIDYTDLARDIHLQMWAFLIGPRS